MTRRARGFTLVELLVTLALLGIAAAIALPFGALVQTRAKEAELRVALRTIRQALDNYKAAADAGVIDKPTGSSGYPPSLDVLAQGVPKSASMGSNATPLVFLRRVPRDPFSADPGTPAPLTWSVRSYGAPAGDFQPGPDVFDVSSKSSGTALDGSKLSNW
jgi:general secretion pathway protein G